MALVRLVELEEVPPTVQEVFRSGEEQYGQALNTWRAIAHNPSIFEAYLPYVRAIFAPAALDQRTKELASLRVGILNHCRYTVSHRADSSRKFGIPDEDIVGLLDPPNHNFSDAERAALAFTQELTTEMDKVSYSENRQAVSEVTLMRLKKHFSDAEISELCVTIGLWNALSRFHRVMDFDLDMPTPPEALDKAL